MSTAINTAMSAREWAMLVTLSVLWGGSFFFVGVAVSELPPLTIVILRVGLAAIALWVLVAATGRALPRAPRIWLAFAAMGVLNNVIPFSLIVWGQTQIASGLASILNATAPLFTVMVAGWLLADERITPAKLTGVAVGLAGVVTIIGPGALGDLGANTLAQLAILGAALSYAFAAVFGRRFKALGVDPLLTAAGQVSASTVLLLPVVLVVERPWELATPGAATVWSVLALAVASTAFAYVLFFRLLASAGATNLLLVTFLIPVSAILLGVLVLEERLDGAQLAGMALIGAGLAVIDGRLWRRLRARRALPET